jgi:hypothetical protein
MVSITLADTCAISALHIAGRGGPVPADLFRARFAIADPVSPRRGQPGAHAGRRATDYFRASCPSPPCDAMGTPEVADETDRNYSILLVYYKL